MSDYEITTGKAGREYRATFKGHRLTLLFDQEQEVVMVYSKTTRFGGFGLRHFGGTFNRDGIRYFLTQNDDTVA